MSILMGALGAVMRFCYRLTNNYGLAIILFTLISKIVLLPVSVWVQKNSIKIVKMQPEINRLKVRYFGDKDMIAEEQGKIFKREKYSAFATIIPLVIQIALLLALIGVIYRPLTYILKMGADTIASIAGVTAAATGENAASASIQLAAVNDIRSGIHDSMYLGALGAGAGKLLDSIKNFHINFLGLNLGWIPARVGGIAILIPLIAGLSAFILAVVQNSLNILQAEQPKVSKYGTMALSVGISLYLGFFVPAGVALYWIASNVFTLLQSWLLNIFIDPKKHVDEEDLEKSRQELKALEEMGAQEGTKEEIRALKKREKEDYKRFFSVVNKHLVFYSESNGFYKYYSGIISYILENTNITIHYITSDPNDNIFKMAESNSQIRAYYIGERRLITLMMKMDADVVVMTMPDIENFHIKRSYIRKDIEYVYIPHGMVSLNVMMRTGSMDHYDTVYCTGKHQLEEAEKTDELHDITPRRKFIKWGYSLLDDMRRDYNALGEIKHDRPHILIAPSWQKDNITDLCLEPMLDNIKGKGYQVTVRPHPQQVRHEKERFEMLKKRFENDPDIEIQTDFSSNSTVFEADLIISDWSGIAYEFCFTTCKPALFVNTPMKVMNPEWEKIDVVPINIWSRDVMGISLAPDEMDKLDETVRTLLDNRESYHDRIEQLVEEYTYNLGTSAKVGADYIISAVQRQIENNRKK